MRWKLIHHRLTSHPLSLLPDRGRLPRHEWTGKAWTERPAIVHITARGEGGPYRLSGRDRSPAGPGATPLRRSARRGLS